MEGGDIFIQDFINDLQESSESHVQKCFRGSCVLITGGTGFVGKVLIEKLLRSCRDLNTIYIIARPLNNRNPNDRVKEIFVSPLFDRMKIENPTYSSQIQVVNGDFSEPNLGIDEVDVNRIKSKINVVIHLAATSTNKNPTLHEAVCTNVRATRDLIALSKRFQNLKAFVHVSSVFTNPSVLDVHEQFYTSSIPASTLIQMVESLPDYILERLTSGVMSEWPDVVTFTKALSEQFVQSVVASQVFPVCVVRPGFVLGTANEPIAGWTNHLNNLTGCALGSGLGLVRIFYGPKYVNAEIVPVDMLVNLLLVACWDLIGIKTDVINEQVPRNEVVNTYIYNYASSNYKPCSWNQLGEKFFKNEKAVSSPHSFWMPFYYVTNSIFIYWIMTFCLHTVPANIVDLFIWLLGKKPKLTEFYKRVHAAAKHLNSYQQMRIRYYNHNVNNLMNKLSARDKILFGFDMSTLSWDDYFDRYLRGLRVYLMGNRLHRPETNNNNTLNRLIMIHYNLIIPVLCFIVIMYTIYFHF